MQITLDALCVTPSPTLSKYYSWSLTPSACASWRRHELSVKLIVDTSDAVRLWLLTPSGTVPSMKNRDAVFFTFMLQKRPKCFLFQISLQNYLKWQKERFRAIFDQINSNPGLNDHLKVVHFSPHQSVEGSVQPNELMGLCTSLVKHTLNQNRTLPKMCKSLWKVKHTNLP